ncbi:THAP domain-containing 9 [Paramuricea clavata]|uniref:THAP domain-containing 9, partial n=1 Tax=Paramuricea clavata TaxID=317549 RepID=A0A6S7KAD4_PARCT|nr:THAP domain-containing 9 [Paramuricea clavata]
MTTMMLTYQKMIIITIIKQTSTKLIPSTSAAILHVKSPVYTIYRDRRVDLASKDGSLPEHLVHDIVRATVSNMVSVALSEPWNRLPTSMELKEMAKSLIVTYPLLRDPVSGHELMKRLVTQKKKKNPGAYPEELRTFAMTLKFYSAKAYKYVRKSFDLGLPHPSVLSSWYTAMDGEPGFTKEALTALKAKVLAGK